MYIIYFILHKHEKEYEVNKEKVCILVTEISNSNLYI